MVTVTSVALSADLRHARVYFTMFGDTAARDATLAGLRSASGFLRTEMAHRLGLRVVPELNFEFDPSFEEADRVLRLLKETLPGEGES
jgi:ribosome-binding factor A